jgi:hypothetical protein
MNRKPKHMPQISAPFEYVIDGLKRDGVVYKDITLQADDILPSQQVTFLDSIDVDKTKKVEPIWVAGSTDEENVVVDGHHRWVDYLSTNKPIRATKIIMKPNDACRVLNKIQDIYEYQTSTELEEMATHFQNINDRNDPKNDGYVDDFDWLGKAIKETEELNADKEKTPKKIYAYRDKPINENSLVGNFFSLNKLPKCDKYEIEFDNLLDTNELGIDYKDDQNPIDILVRLWFPGINFVALSEKHQTTEENLKNKAISEYAQKMGYDGIKYGNIMVQGFK